MEISVKDIETGEVFRTQPARDIAFFTPRLVTDVESRLQPEKLSQQDQQRLKTAGENPKDLQRTFACFMVFMDLSRDPDLKSPYDALTTSGFLSQKPVSRQLVMEKFGQSCLGAFWAGIRSSVMQDECPPVLSNLRRRGLELLEQLAGRG